MRWHKYDINRLISQLLPIHLRRLNLFLFLSALLSPLAKLMNDIRYKMQHDCRVIYLEKMLNEIFEMPGYDPNQHEETKIIYIGPGNIPDELYIYLDTEPNEPAWLGGVYLLTIQEQLEDYYDFCVIVPQGYDVSENKLRRWVDFYKLAGKKYIIIYE